MRSGTRYKSANLGGGRISTQHVAIVERVLGHRLPIGAIVHHVNEQTFDNRNANLCVLQDEGEHKQLHLRLRILRLGGDPWRDRYCRTCTTVKPLDEFAKRSSGDGRRSQCKLCAAAYLHDWKATRAAVA